jgi:hypothetical protein
MSGPKLSERERERRRAERLAKRVISFLRLNRGWRFCYANLSGSSFIRAVMREKDHLQGWTFFEEKIVLLDRGCETIGTVIHEVAHVLHPKMHELKVRKMERLIMRDLSSDAAARVHRYVGRRLIHKELRILEELVAERLTPRQFRRVQRAVARMKNRRESERYLRLMDGYLLTLGEKELLRLTR